MIFAKPDYIEVYVANWKNDNFQDEVLIHTISNDYKVQTHAPIDLFFHSRNRVIVRGCRNDGEWVFKNYMSIRTKKQEYAGWPPILTVADFEKAIQLLINKELAKAQAYKAEPKKYPFYKQYSLS